jgi:hypothetical protein
MKAHYRLVKYVLKHPIERMRGGPALVQLEVNYTVELQGGIIQEITVPGVALIPDTLTMEAIDQEIDRALINAEKRLQTVINSDFGVIESNQLQHLRTILLKRKSEVEEKLLTQSPDKKDALSLPATTNQQTRLNNVCDELGFPRINLSDPQSTVLEAMTIIAEMESLLRGQIRVEE